MVTRVRSLHDGGFFFFLLRTMPAACRMVRTRRMCKLTRWLAAIETRALILRRCYEQGDRLFPISVHAIHQAAGRRTGNLQFRRQNGSQETPITLPKNSPKKVRPVCHRLKPWLFPKTSGNACEEGQYLFVHPFVRARLTPKKRYRIPSKIADSRHRFRHIGLASVSKRIPFRIVSSCSSPREPAAETAECNST